MTTFARRPVAAHPPRRARMLGSLPAPVLAALVLGAGTAVAADPSPSAGPEAIELVASGPFGTVAGVATSTGGPPPDPRGLPVLDAWARDTTIVVRPTTGTLAPWHATLLAEPDLDPSAAISAGSGDGDALIRLPTTGLFLTRVEGTIRPDGGAIDGSWWWRIAVPDRERPEDETGPAAPAIRLASGDHDAALEPGSGCYVGTCGDIGGISPPDLLPTVRTIPGAPLSIRLADGSGVVAWAVAATPVGGGEADEVVLGRAPDTWATQAWVTAPAEGDWVITVSVTFDRERGRSDGYGRLVVGPSPTG